MKRVIGTMIILSSLNVMAAQDSLDDALSTSVVSAPTIISSNSISVTTDGLSNEIILVRQDAIIALETGVYSLDLQAVIQKLRREDVQLAELSDQEILMFIIEQ